MLSSPLVGNKEEKGNRVTTEMPIIRRVPESLRTTDSETAYIPCQVGMGPYHHFHPELYKMEGLKLAVAKSGLQRFNIPDFRALVRELRPLIPRIRACYDDALFSPEFEWAMAVDGLFLLSLLCETLLFRLGQSPAAGSFFFHVNIPGDLTKWRTKLLFAMAEINQSLQLRRNYQSRPAAFPQCHMLSAAVLNDAVLLENQIPIFIFVEAVAIFEPAVHQLVVANLNLLFNFLSPIELRSTPEIRVRTPFPATHLLEYLYLMITGDDCNGDVDPNGSGTVSIAVDGGRLDVHNEILQQRIPHHLTSSATTGDNPITVARDYILPKLASVAHFLLAVAVNLSFGLVFCFFPRMWRNVAGSHPTATQLRWIGRLTFQAKTLGGGGGPTIEFNEETRTVSVPAFRWHPYCDVVMRNLLAYEATSVKSHRVPVLAQYLHFLHMVVRTRGDAEWLIQTGVVVLVKNDDPEAEVTALQQFCDSLYNCDIIKDQVVDDGNIITAYEAVKRYYHSRPQAVAFEILVTLCRLFCLVVVCSFQGSVVAVLSICVACGLLKNFAGCTVDGSGSCAANVTASLISVVGDGNSSFLLDG